MYIAGRRCDVDELYGPTGVSLKANTTKRKRVDVHSQVGQIGSNLSWLVILKRALNFYNSLFLIGHPMKIHSGRSRLWNSSAEKIFIHFL